MHFHLIVMDYCTTILNSCFFFFYRSTLIDDLNGAKHILQCVRFDCDFYFLFVTYYLIWLDNLLTLFGRSFSGWRVETVY